MRIALVAAEYSRENHGGGIGSYTHTLAHALASQGNTVHIVTHGLHPGEIKREGNALIHYADVIRFIPMSGRRFWSSGVSRSLYQLEYSVGVSRVLNRIQKQYGLDIVEFPLWDAEGFFLASTRFTQKLPFVVRLETPLRRAMEKQGRSMTFDLRLASRMEGFVARKADKVIAISNAIKNDIAGLHNVVKDKIVVQPLGILLPSDDQVENQGKVLLSNSQLKVVFLGRLEPRKGIIALLSAIALLVPCISVDFFLIGRDLPLAPGNITYREYATNTLEPSVLQHVHFLGSLSRSEVEQHLASATLFVAPSTYESFGLVYVEAMAWGKPVVGCRVGGVPEVVADNETGLLVEPDDPASLAQAIHALLTNVTLREDMGKAARLRATRYFSAQTMAESTLKVYEEAINNHG